MDDSKTLFLSEKGDGSLDVYIGFKASDNWALESDIDLKNVKEVSEWFKEEYKGWDNFWMELFEQQQTEFLARPLYGMPLDQKWETQNNVTLLGDAAHLLPPNGEGVNSAMLDALILSENLTSGVFKDLKAAIADYEEQMFARFASEGKETAEMMDFMYSPDGLKIMIAMFNELPN